MQGLQDPLPQHSDDPDVSADRGAGGPDGALAIFRADAERRGYFAPGGSGMRGYAADFGLILDERETRRREIVMAVPA